MVGFGACLSAGCIFLWSGDRFCLRGFEFVMLLAWLLLLKSILEKRVSSSGNHW